VISIDLGLRTWPRYVLAVLGVAALCFGCVGASLRSDAISIGTVLVLGTSIWQLAVRKSKNEDALYEAGRQNGYDAGFMDGRRVAKPVVVPIAAGGQRSNRSSTHTSSTSRYRISAHAPSVNVASPSYAQLGRSGTRSRTSPRRNWRSGSARRCRTSSQRAWTTRRFTSGSTYGGWPRTVTEQRTRARS
jgi:hypothetical protein